MLITIQLPHVLFLKMDLKYGIHEYVLYILPFNSIILYHLIYLL